jgi:hypothetical protein
MAAMKEPELISQNRTTGLPFFTTFDTSLVSGAVRNGTLIYIPLIHDIDLHVIYSILDQNFSRTASLEYNTKSGCKFVASTLYVEQLTKGIPFRI